MTRYIIPRSNFGPYRTLIKNVTLRSKEVRAIFLACVISSQLIAVHVEKRENPIVNRLNKTKVIKEVDHEQEKTDRIKAESAIRKTEAIKQVDISL